MTKGKFDNLYSCEFGTLDATDQALLVQKKKVSPLELIDAAIRRIEIINPKINAFASLNLEQAREQAKSANLPNGPFKGVPFALKEFGDIQEGVVCALGNKRLKELANPSSEDSLLGARFRKTGLVTLGSTCAPEYGLRPTTDTQANGTVHNPWDLKHTVGGSSGGAAAAVASGMLPIAHASDGGGSIRGPASWCGLVGLNTSRGRVPVNQAYSFISRGTDLVVSRSVRDTARILDCMEGSASVYSYGIRSPTIPYSKIIESDPCSLKIGVMTKPPFGVEASEDAELAIKATVEVLESLGHHVEEAWPSVLTTPLEDSMYQNIPDMARMQLHRLESLLGREITSEDVEPFTWAVSHLPGATLLDYFKKVDAETKWVAGVLNWWNSEFDLLLTPAIAFSAPTNLELRPSQDDPLTIRREYAKVNAYLRPFNVTGQPSISLPLYQTEKNMPFGMQFVADIGREDLLLQLASQLENVVAWGDKQPPVFAS